MSFDNLPIIQSPLFYPTVAIFIALTVLYFTIRRFLLKHGMKLLGTYAIASSIECDDEFVSCVTIENLKDKTIVIFGIYLKIGNDVYIEVESFEDAPLMIKPFEAYQKQYGEIDM